MTKMAEAIDIAFAGNETLRKRIYDAINDTPQYAPLFEDIAKHQLTNQQFSLVNGKANEDVEQPSKKRKLENGSPAVNSSQSDQPRTVILEVRDVSFTLPQRKKLHLGIVQYGGDYNSSSTKFALCGRNPATSQVEFELPLTSFAYALRVPVPEKAQKQYNFCFLPSQTQPTDGAGTSTEAVIWSINHGPLKSYQVHNEDLKAVVGSENVLENALDAVLQKGGNKLVYPTENEFVSALVESHRKTDKAYHVKAFRGSKDGFLFFLENGIFFGFKKPLAFYSFNDIDSVSYTAVLQRTFNLVIVARGKDDAESQEIEFSMLDQADFAGIDAYIKKHQLQDSSMAEARRAKQFKVNGAKGTTTESEADNGQSELQKAEQELEDEEDELEEDYDPGSDGESEGSGSSDEEDDYKYPANKKGKDLVKDELGSEAEDVEITDEEDADEDEGEGEGEDEEEEEVIQAPVPLPAPVHATQKGFPISARPVPAKDMPDYDDEDQL